MSGSEPWPGSRCRLADERETIEMIWILGRSVMCSFNCTSNEAILHMFSSTTLYSDSRLGHGFRPRMPRESGQSAASKGRRAQPPFFFLLYTIVITFPSTHTITAITTTSSLTYFPFFLHFARTSNPVWAASKDKQHTRAPTDPQKSPTAAQAQIKRPQAAPRVPDRMTLPALHSCLFSSGGVDKGRAGTIVRPPSSFFSGVPPV